MLQGAPPAAGIGPNAHGIRRTSTKPALTGRSWIRWRQNVHGVCIGGTNRGRAPSLSPD
jgi:hypothetical protein